MGKIKTDDCVLRIEETLGELYAAHDWLYNTVKLRYFAGLPVVEAVGLMEMLARSVFRARERAPLIMADARRGEPAHGARA